MHLLILRFSSIGDVALTIPVLLKCKERYPEVKLTMVAPKMYRPLFEPLDIGFVEADLKGTHKGITGLSRLYRKIRKEVKPDVVIDLHSVLRTHVLQALFTLKRTPFFRIDKGREEKARLTRQENKIRKPLMHTAERYAAVFEKAGFPLDFKVNNPPLPRYQKPEAEAYAQTLQGHKMVGIAPLAAVPGKSWPLPKMKEVINDLLKNGLTPVLFGGPADIPHLQKLKGQSEQVLILAGKFDFAGEISFMSKLELMISMDSSNMHLATLAGIPVVSIWGATHPFAGFGPLGENTHLQAAVPVQKLECRPCSVFGNKPCFRKDYACLHWLESEQVIQKVKTVIDKAWRE